MSGIFLSRGARFNTKPLEIGLSDAGDIVVSPLSLEIVYDMYPQWLAIAVDQADICARCAATTDAQWLEASPAKQSQLLEAELRAGMVTIVAAAAALDGLYGVLTSLAPLPPDLVDAWRRKKLERGSWIAEAIRRSFRVPDAAFKTLRTALIEIFKARAKAIHPSAEAKDAIAHPRLDVGVEQRFVLFRAENAHNAARSALNIISQLLNVPLAKHTKLVEHCVYGREWVEPMVEAWEAKHGSLHSE